MKFLIIIGLCFPIWIYFYKFGLPAYLKLFGSETPRVFLALSNDDDLVPAINGARYYQECNNHGLPASIHIHSAGGHGWGYHAYFDYHLEILRELKNWLQSFLCLI